MKAKANIEKQGIAILFLLLYAKVPLFDTLHLKLLVRVALGILVGFALLVLPLLLLPSTATTTATVVVAVLTPTREWWDDGIGIVDAKLASILELLKVCHFPGFVHKLIGDSG